MKLYWPYLMAFLIIATNAIAKAQDFNIFAASEAEEEREKRAIDFGQFVRNLLLKSAAASDVKSGITRNVANFKATTRAPRRRTTTTTTTTTVAPFFFNKGPFKFPFDLSAPFNNKINNRGYINFDYNDYGGVAPTVRPGRRRRPTTTTTTTTTTRATTTRAPLPTPRQRQRQRQPPPRRGPIPRRPYGLFGKQKIPQFQYYNDDDVYDYNYEDDDDDYDTQLGNNTTTSQPATRRPPPPPPSARPQRPPTAARARAQGRVPQLRNRLVYQFRQPDDISTNNNFNNAQPPPPLLLPTAAAATPTEDSTTSTNNDTESQTEINSENEDTGNNEETSVNTNDDYTDDSAGAQQDDNIDTNNASDDTNNNNNNNYNFNLPSLPPFPTQTQNQFNYAGENYGGNFGPSAGFQYPAYNDYGTQYQSPSAPADYALAYY